MAADKCVSAVFGLGSQHVCSMHVADFAFSLSHQRAAALPTGDKEAPNPPQPDNRKERVPIGGSPLLGNRQRQKHGSPSLLAMSRNLACLSQCRWKRTHGWLTGCHGTYSSTALS
jgi:hypothetical protein